MGGHPPFPPRKRIPRIITAVCVFLLLGAIVNVAVAWGVVLWVNSPLGAGTPTDYIARTWRSFVPSHWSDEGYIYENSNWALTESRGYGSLRNPLTMTMLYSLTAGFPCRSLGRTVCQEQLVGESLGRPEQQVPDNWREGVIWPDRLAWVDSQYRGVLPTYPVWPGFAINTVFYAALLWLMFAAPFALRRSIRRRRGLCPACAYPVGESDICTECGKPLVKHKAEPPTQKAQST